MFEKWSALFRAFFKSLEQKDFHFNTNSYPVTEFRHALKSWYSPQIVFFSHLPFFFCNKRGFDICGLCRRCPYSFPVCKSLANGQRASSTYFKCIKYTPLQKLWLEGDSPFLSCIFEDFQHFLKVLYFSLDFLMYCLLRANWYPCPQSSIGHDE